LNGIEKNPDLSFIPVLGLLNLMLGKKNGPIAENRFLEKISNFFNKF